MDFLTRFQGRTNLIPKKGIDHLMTEPSTPIAKLVVECIEETPQVFLKPRQMGAIKSHRSTSNPKGPQAMNASRGSITPLNQAMVGSHPNQIGHQNSQTRLQTDPMFIDQEGHMPMGHQPYYKSQSNLLQKNKEMTPRKNMLLSSHSSAYMMPKEPMSASVTPSYSLNSTKTNSMLITTNISVPNQSYMKADETPSSRFKMNNSMMSRSVDPYTPKYSYAEAQNNKAQENRISLMNTFERQEKVLHKYRQSLFSEGAFPNPGRMNQSKGYLPLSPKHEFLQHYPPF